MAERINDFHINVAPVVIEVMALGQTPQNPLNWPFGGTYFAGQLGLYGLHFEAAVKPTHFPVGICMF